MIKILGTCIMVAALSVLVGCGTLPVEVTDSYRVPAGQPVELFAQSNSPALILGVEIDLGDIELPGGETASGLPEDAKVYLIYGAERR